MLCHVRTFIRVQSVLRPLHSRTMAASLPVAILQEVGDKGVITLNRPKALNALNHDMIQLIHPRLKEWESTKSMVIIKGMGEKAFCAGGDVRAIVETAGQPNAIGEYFFRDEYILNCLIGTLHIPYIALIDGITMGGGVGLSVHGQYRVATERTVFAMPETGIGLFPDVGGSHFLPRLGGRLGMFLALTGHRLKGRDVLKAGIATHVCDGARIEELEESLLSLQSPYPEDIAAVLEKFHEESTFNKGEPFSLQSVLPKIQSCFTGASVEEIFGNLEKNGSEWAEKQLKILKKMSPTSLKVTFEQLERGTHLTLQECLAMEYRIVKRIYKGHDFSEGIRAVLVDRDNNPQWKPKNLEEVTTEVVEEHFAPLPEEEELEL
ncbi:3-hydroxyisobutyryl-CoA hydrolase, mitochondrial-like isoform X1 [Eriocheir sinensis]|uniref:3-hydroxyisobutyryl-CoA hydrolase, mitochondrial-like isoform X1 n=1 Tax=Eriocheir sinensis TaxID=95602 RepID=UPI0021C80D64|nr:3-hydroxyisobutyryl-CoA hydrolase, mitochondrial-like isoform X1 [Eriocheir sinensis]XP_050715798.1 3-hydroxyisobutyryl-CoA hydrolase, mitochondrial-like isoform X1 [Eriocheir sinensis]XP_050715799.1 3-hydroxyisobutyryl-CoA hydrolase, mitochondrial-like isoform X1 [Eriocheir sinensis]XP_050715800.1 3-hydroxyisobutyryl-CoA hydrolase, mitochondrial-like isoform X1 [Eriocheir sinensis]XP_050715801.1 3-hydroxyisobutyryl-CoA hydrolase, mitochondrial-like isoform X1 [Eriocheir sinensis]XP_0507158